MLEGAEVYGLGSWADIADHIGGFRTKEEVRDHYISTYIDSPNFPLPARADPNDMSLTDQIPRETFQARKKQRIEERKEAARNAPPAAPKQKPTSSVPSCHEIQGYMPGRLEFETEFYNDAEEAVQHMQFEPGDGLNPHTGAVEPEMELKTAVMDIYNSRLTGRALRKRTIFEHGWLEYKKNALVDKRRTKEERELAGRVKPMARAMNRGDHEELAKGLEQEHNLRQAIAQLNEWRHHGLGDLRSGEKYEVEKLARLQRPGMAAVAGSLGLGGANNSSSLDRSVSGTRPSKPAAPVEIPEKQAELTAPSLPERLKAQLRPSANNAPTTNGHPTIKRESSTLTNGATNGVHPHPQRAHFSPTPVPGMTPLKLLPDAPDLHLLSGEERELCGALRMQPKAYLVLKEALLREATKAGGQLRKKSAREVCRIDAQRSGRLWEFFVRSGWVQKV